MPDQITSDDQASGDQDQRAPPGRIPLAKLISPQPETPPSEDNAHNSEANNGNAAIARSNVYMAIFSGLIFLVNIGYVWVATQQWGAMSAQVGEMQKQVAAINT
jgi:hypothetical protein